MRNLKRVLSLALALVMVLGMMVIGTSAATFAEEEIENVEAVEVMNALGIVKGDGGKFNPDRVLTREEAAKILAYVVLGPKVEDYLTGSESPFTDVKADRWSAKYIAFCKNAKYIHGVSDTEFNPKGQLTVIGFGKLLLGAVGFDTDKYTGGGWIDAVKTDMEKVGLDIVEKFDDKTLIDRDTACQMALIAMQYGVETFEYVVWDDADSDDVIDANEEILAKYDNARDAALDKQLLAGKTEYKKVSVKENLLKKVYGVSVDTEGETDVFGRPGYTYTNGKTDATKLEMFYANEALATFEGPVAQKAIFAAAKVADKTATYINYTIIEDGLNITDDWKFVEGVAYKDNKDSTTDEQFAAGTGYGIKSELYVDADGNYTLVSIREYLGTVKKVTPADEKVEDSKRTITVELTVLPTGREESAEIVYETEDFAAKDVVVVTVAGAKIQTIALAETVKGAVTKLANGVATIGGKEYVSSQNAKDVVLGMDGKEYSWYVDSFGNLLKSVDAPEEPADVYYYGIFVDAEGKLYKAAGEDTLLTEGKDGQEAAEVIKLLTAEGKEVVFNTAWKYTYDAEDETKITGVTYINGEVKKVEGVDTYVATLDKTDDEATTAAGKLVKYALDENGKIKTINVVTDKGATGELEAGKAVLGEGYANVVTDKTVFFVMDTTATTPKFVAYTGYKNVPAVEFDEAYYVVGSTATVADDGTYAIVMLKGAAVEEEKEPEYSYIYFAGTNYATEWDAAANEGKGAKVYVYENVYLNGVKSTVKFAAEQTKAAKGALYAYEVNAKTGALNINYSTNLLVETDVVTLIHADFFKAGDVHYVNADTVYYQVTATGLTKVDALPEVDTDESIVVKYVLSETLANKDVVAAAVYFTVEETAKIDTSVATVATKEELAAAAAAGGKIVLTADINLSGSVVIEKEVTVELNGKTITCTDDTVGDGVFYVAEGGDLTINGDGVIDGVNETGWCMAIWANGGDVTINGGTYTNVGAADGGGSVQLDLIYVKNGSSVTINGGYFKSQTPQWTLNSHNTLLGTFVVKGGSFLGFDPSNPATDDAATYVATGYAATLADGVYTVAAE